MFLSKLKNGYYYVYYFKPNGIKAKSSTKEKRKGEALKYLSNFSNILKERESNKIVPITLNNFLFEYLIYSEFVHAHNTTLSIKSTFNRIKEYFPNLQLAKITTSDCMIYLQQRMRDGKSMYVIRRDIAYLHAAFRYAINTNYLLQNPMDSIRKPKVQEQLPLFYTREEYNKLISVIDNKDIKDLIVVAVNTGLRQMELLTLQWSQVNFEDKLLILDNQNFVSKSKKIRSIPLNTTTMNILLKRNNNMNSSYVFTYNDQPIKY